MLLTAEILFRGVEVPSHKIVYDSDRKTKTHANIHPKNTNKHKNTPNKSTSEKINKYNFPCRTLAYTVFARGVLTPSFLLIIILLLMCYL